MIKKIFSFLSNLPAFTNLFKQAAQTGRLDPVETLNALSSISPSTKKVSDVALDAVNKGGGIPEVARAVTNIGEVEVMGQKLNTRTLVQDLKKTGGVCAMAANVLEKMQGQNPVEIVDFGNAATNIKNWQDIVAQ